MGSLNRAALGSLEADAVLPGRWHDGDSLERAADEALVALRQRRGELARRHWWTRVQDRFDRRVRTDAVEYLDRPDYPEQRKLELIRRLHRFNRAMLSYHRFLAYLRPCIRNIANTTGRPVRALELASGAGELTLELARLAEKRGLPVKVTGSDIVPGYVEAGNARARRRGLSTRFIELNAFEMEHLAGQFDLVFVTQSMHHFSAGQLARMIAQSAAAGARSFVGIDGRRSLFMLGFLPVATTVMGDPHFRHDAIVSARRFYSDPELQLIARTAAPESRVHLRRAEPGFTVLSVHHR